jgi:hypothetical protein
LPTSVQSVPSRVHDSISSSGDHTRHMAPDRRGHLPRSASRPRHFALRVSHPMSLRGRRAGVKIGGGRVRAASGVPGLVEQSASRTPDDVLARARAHVREIGTDSIRVADPCLAGRVPARAAPGLLVRTLLPPCWSQPPTSFANDIEPVRLPPPWRLSTPRRPRRPRCSPARSSTRPRRVRPSWLPLLPRGRRRLLLGRIGEEMRNIQAFRTANVVADRDVAQRLVE